MRSRSAMPVAVGLALAIALGGPGTRPAAAHAELEDSTPAASSVLAESPPVVRLDFDEPVEETFAEIVVIGEGGDEYELDAPEHLPADDTQVVSRVPALPDGLYVVQWQVVSQDGHAARGAFPFRVGTGGSGGDQAFVDEVLGGRSLAAPAAVRYAAGAARFAAVTGWVLLAGALALALAVAGRRPEHDHGDGSPPAGGPHDGGHEEPWARMVRLSWVGWAAALAGTAADVALAGPVNAHRGFGAVLDPDRWRDVAATRTGTVLLARVVLLAGALVLLRTVRAHRHLWWRWASLGLAAAVLVTFGLARHPGSGRLAALGVALDAVHLGAVALWAGGLLALAVARRRWLAADAGPSISRALGRFSALSAVCVGLVVVTGVAQAWRLLGTADGLTDTAYGRTLLVKTVLAVVLVALGAGSRWLLRSAGPGAVRRTVLVEAATAAAILGLVAGLVVLPPGRAQPPEPFVASLTQADLLVDVSLTPARVGENELHVTITPPGGTLQRVAGATARLSLPERGISPIPVPLVEDGPNHFTAAAFQLPLDGLWQLELVVEPEPGRSVLLRTTVPVR